MQTRKVKLGDSFKYIHYRDSIRVGLQLLARLLANGVKLGSSLNSLVRRGKVSNMTRKDYQVL